MLCIYCGHDTQVVNSRSQKKLNHIWRRRKCAHCKAVFTTTETPDLLKSLVVSNSSGLSPFSRDILFLSIYDSLKHRKTALQDAVGLTDTVIAKLYPDIDNGCITGDKVTSVTLQTLGRFDKPATTHYAAYHP